MSRQGITPRLGYLRLWSRIPAKHLRNLEVVYLDAI